MTFEKQHWRWTLPARTKTEENKLEIIWNWEKFVFASFIVDIVVPVNDIELKK